MVELPWILALLLVLSVVGVPESRGYEQRVYEDYVHSYVELSYNRHDVSSQHHRHKRSMSKEDHQVRLDFQAHGFDFRLRMKRDLSVFHNDLVIVDQDENHLNRLDTAHIYEGHLEGYGAERSLAFGAIRDGVFDGQIVTPEGTFFVERTQRFFKGGGNKNASFHSVIYHEKHLKDPFKHAKVGIGSQRPGCGATDSVLEWMGEVQRSGEPSVNVHPNEIKREKVDRKPGSDVFEYNDPGPEFKYSAQANEPLLSTRSKRAARANPSNKKSCSLYIQTDPLFWRHIHEEEKDAAKTEEEILSLIAQHVKAVNRIYSDTTFDGKYKHHGYQFEVQRIKIHNDSQCSSSNRRGLEDPERSQFCIPNIDVSNFLNMHSKSNHEAFCLAYVFTYRDFTGGTLGLAWVASASGASGGICETYKGYKENINGQERHAKRSLNTGIITFVNYNTRVPPKVSQLTLAHEIGHNFGSPHDYRKDCRPGGKTGNYIMFASATSGDRANNNQFSICSKQNVSSVLDAIVDGRKPNCFTESDGAFCGNKIVEDGEECDCGFDEHECTESCCYPRKSDRLSEEENKRNRCKRKAGVECSPSEGPCCNSDCHFIPQWDKVQCKDDQDCTDVALCDGTQAKCPNPQFKPDNVTECNQGTQVCQSGECKDSICVKYGLVSCFLTSDLVSDKRQLCELACQRPGKNNTCMSTHDLVKLNLVSTTDLKKGLSLRPGSPCDNFQGYCDVFLKCRKVDAEGPLARLKNLLFNQETLLTIAQWVTEFWWAVLLMGISFVIFMAIFIRCFAIHTPSSNPHLPKNLHISETLRRPVRSLQQKHYRPANGQGAPPPYPGRGTSRDRGHSGGPGRGYGEGRGHYNRSQEHFAASSGGDRTAHHRSYSRGDHNGGRSGHRSSRMEMQPMR